MEACAIGDGTGRAHVVYVRPAPPAGAPSLLPVDHARAPDLVRGGGGRVRIEYTGYATGYRLWWLYHGDSRTEFAKLEFNPRHDDLDALHRDVEDAVRAWVCREATLRGGAAFFRPGGYGGFTGADVAQTLLANTSRLNSGLVIQALPECGGGGSATEDEEDDLSEEEMDFFIDHCCDAVED